ncbi:MAG TPA: proteasome activator, partial [Nocardioides sp.]|nr:proteasome activator [Nocardioides sp.]
MTEQRPDNGPEATPENEQDPRVVVLGPDGMAVAGGSDDADDAERQITDLVEQPAKVMRIGSMIRQLLDEVKSAP